MLTQEQQEKYIGALLKRPQNAICADCSAKSPCWASLDFGVFVCMNCSGAHRSLGQSVTRIKSTKLDTWNKDWLWHMQLNNKIINDYFQATLNPVMHKKPTPNSSLNDIKKFVNDKYVRRLFSRDGQDDPITNLKNGKFPTKSQGSKKQQPNMQKKQPQPPKSVNSPKVITQPIKKVDSLLDDVSNYSNKVPSQKNQKVREEINLFDDQPSSAGLVKNIGLHPPMYSKEHYNSFSGVGAQHSSTGAVNFNDIFNSGQSQPKQNPNVNFDIFNTLTGTTPVTQAPHHYGHIHQHNLPHMNIHSTGVGTGYGHHHQAYPSHTHTHVTMNINMNMYSNVMNFNLKDDPASNKTSNSSNTNNGSGTGGFNNLAEHIKLDISDFKEVSKKQPVIEEKKSSWVDQWR